jgi:hypothetical protein
MNIHEQLGALEMGVDQLIQAVVAKQAENTPETPAQSAAPQAPAEHDASANSAAPAEPVAAESTDAVVETEAAQAAVEPTAEPQPAQRQAALQIDRPSQDEITMTIGDQSVALRPDQISRLIEELSNARASMTPEQPPGIPPGWRFVSTKNPVMAVQKQSSGDRLLVMRHTGHGWVPFTFSPDMVIQLYMMLTNAK